MPQFRIPTRDEPNLNCPTCRAGLHTALGAIRDAHATIDGILRSCYKASVTSSTERCAWQDGPLDYNETTKPALEVTPAPPVMLFRRNGGVPAELIQTCKPAVWRVSSATIRPHRGNLTRETRCHAQCLFRHCPCHS